VIGPRVLLDGLGFPESTRWHGGRVWLCNWGSGEVLAVTPEGKPEVAARLAPRTLPFSIDWLPDGACSWSTAHSGSCFVSKDPMTHSRSSRT
jgi:hypothetical protein